RIESLGFAPRNEVEQIMAARRNGAMGKPFETPMTRCLDCAARLEQAERLVALFPGVVRTSEFVFSGTQAVEAIERVLAVIAAAQGQSLLEDSRDIRLACEHLLSAAPALFWKTRF